MYGKNVAKSFLPGIFPTGYIAFYLQKHEICNPPHCLLLAKYQSLTVNRSLLTAFHLEWPAMEKSNSLNSKMVVIASSLMQVTVHVA